MTKFNSGILVAKIWLMVGLYFIFAGILTTPVFRNFIAKQCICETVTSVLFKRAVVFPYYIACM